MKSILIEDIVTVEEISEQAAASISGGRYRKTLFVPKVTSADTLFNDPLKVGDDSTDDSKYYPGLGKQADNVTPLT